MEHVRHLPRGLGRVSLDGVGQRVHAGRCRQSLGHRAHHLGVYDGDNGHVVRVDADEFALALDIGDDVVYRDLGCRTGGRRDGDDGNAGLFRVRNALERAHVGKLGVIYDDADGLGRVHRRAAADCDEIVGSRRLEGCNTLNNVFDGRVGLNLGINRVLKPRLVQNVGHMGDNAVLYKRRTAADQRLFEAARLYLARYLADCARAVI